MFSHKERKEHKGIFGGETSLLEYQPQNLFAPFASFAARIYDSTATFRLTATTFRINVIPIYIPVRSAGGRLACKNDLIAP